MPRALARILELGGAGVAVFAVGLVVGGGIIYGLHRQNWLGNTQVRTKAAFSSNRARLIQLPRHSVTHERGNGIRAHVERPLLEAHIDSVSANQNARPRGTSPEDSLNQAHTGCHGAGSASMS